MMDGLHFDLHDATLTSVEIDPASSVIRFLLTVHDKKTGRARRGALSMTGYTNAVFARKEPWGPSRSVNALKRDVDSIQIEMQSGDVIRIEGSSDLSFAFLEGEALS